MDSRIVLKWEKLLILLINICPIINYNNREQCYEEVLESEIMTS